ncbi:MAG: winged helix-turn-helix domain-containing protein [Pseudomonadota bacterium]
MIRERSVGLMRSPQQPQTPERAFMLDDIVVDPSNLSLSRASDSVKLEPKVMAVLVALAMRPSQTCRREGLIDQVWSDGSVADESLTRSVYQIRKALSRLGAQRVLATVPRLGYRLDASVKHLDSAAELTVATSEQTSPPFSIAVLPFSCPSTEQEEHWLARGLVSDLSALLARVPRFIVAPVSSIHHHQDNQLSLPRLAKELNTRFVVEGSLLRQENDLRIRISLLEADGGALMWARRYDTQLDQFYEVQDDAVLSIATAISTEVRSPSASVFQRHKRFNVSAYERVQEAESLRQNYGRITAAQITQKLEEALAHDPEDAAVAAALAVQLSQNVVSRWESDPIAAKTNADALIDRALSAAPHDPDVLTGAGVVSTMFHRPDRAIDFLERAIFLNPNDAHAIAVLGWQRCLRDADPGGIALLEAAEARAPHHPRFALWATYRATAHLFMLQYDEGLEAAKAAVARTPNYYQPRLHCAWACAGLGDRDGALRFIAEGHALEDDVLPLYVDEMSKWSANSRHSVANLAALQLLLAIAGAGL